MLSEDWEMQVLKMEETKNNERVNDGGFFPFVWRKRIKISGQLMLFAPESLSKLGLPHSQIGDIGSIFSKLIYEL